MNIYQQPNSNYRVLVLITRAWKNKKKWNTGNTTPLILEIAHCGSVRGLLQLLSYISIPSIVSCRWFALWRRLRFRFRFRLGLWLWFGFWHQLWFGAGLGLRFWHRLGLGFWLRLMSRLLFGLWFGFGRRFRFAWLWLCVWHRFGHWLWFGFWLWL